MHQKSLILLILLLVPSLTLADDPQPTLRQAAGKQFLIGAAITTRQLDDPQKQNLILSQFNCLTPEYQMFPQFIELSPGYFAFDDADRIVDFANQHHIPITGHMLYWWRLTPTWMFEDANHKPLPRDVALANMKTYIDTVVKHFKGKLSSWNVVNEAISEKDNEYLRDNTALRAIGPDYIQKAFEFAHAADPDVPLYYNDFNVEEPVRLAKVIRLIRSLKAAGARLDAVGIQGHWLLDWPDPSVIEDGIVALGKENVKVIVTELDIDVLPRDGNNPYQNGIPQWVLQAEAQRYAELFAVFKRHRDIIPRVTFWGIDDGQSWLNNEPTRGRTNYPLLWDRNLQTKPAYDAVIKELQMHF